MPARIAVHPVRWQHRHLLVALCILHSRLTGCTVFSFPWTHLRRVAPSLPSISSRQTPSPRHRPLFLTFVYSVSTCACVSCRSPPPCSLTLLHTRTFSFHPSLKFSQKLAQLSSRFEAVFFVSSPFPGTESRRNTHTHTHTPGQGIRKGQGRTEWKKQG